MILWPDPPRDDDDTADAVRLYQEMWSIERIAGLFGSNYDAMRRLVARNTKLRKADRHLRRHRLRTHQKAEMDQEDRSQRSSLSGDRDRSGGVADRIRRIGVTGGSSPPVEGLDSPITALGLPDEIMICLAVTPDPPETIGDLLTLARDERLCDIKGIGPARKRTLEVSLRLAGCDLGERPGRQFFLRGRGSHAHFCEDWREHDPE